MLILPTGAAKSTYASKLFPPHYLGKYPKKTILACSHSAHLATSFGRACRNLVDSHEVELGYKLSQDSQAADEWETDKGGEYFCAGVGGRICGRRADLGLIDDPIGSQEDADSETHREKVYQWYRTDFASRLKPNAAIVIMTTRYHEEDLAGRLMKEEGNEWEIIHLVMVVETPEQEAKDPLKRKIGERIWPEYFTEDMVRELKKHPRGFLTRQQGMPTPDEGAFFTKEMFVPYNSYSELPEDLTIYAASDHAVRVRQENDRTCMGAVGVDSRKHIWILPDLYWKRCDTLAAVDAMLELGKRRRPLFWWSGRDNIRGSIGPFLRERMMEQNVYINMVEIVEDKELKRRTQSIHARFAMGTVHCPTFAAWWPQALGELLQFPRSAHDDFVAWLALIGMGLDRVVAPQPVTAETREEVFDLHNIKGSWLKDQKRRARRAEVNDA